MEAIGHWVHDLDPFLIVFWTKENGSDVGIRWYGLSYLAGFVAAYFLLRRYYAKERSPYEGEQILNLMTFLILGVLIGGRLGYVLLYDFDDWLKNPWKVFEVWKGGMASHGGFIGVFLALVWYARTTHQSVLAVGDIVVTVTPPGLFFGRIANFINGELWGRPTEVSWGVLFPEAPGLIAGIARHPSQLYAAVLEGLIPFLYLQWRFWKSDHEKRPAGSLGGEFLCLYGIMRILDEFFREPDASLIAGITRGQFYSCFLIAGGIGLIAWVHRKNSPQAIDKADSE
jgi:phosphatidylglycerol:prolipoprotein diacylglycerol transferase